MYLAGLSAGKSLSARYVGHRISADTVVVAPWSPAEADHDNNAPLYWKQVTVTARTIPSVHWLFRLKARQSIKSIPWKPKTRCSTEWDA